MGGEKANGYSSFEECDGVEEKCGGSCYPSFQLSDIVKLHRDNIQIWPWGWIDGRETVLQTPMSKLVTEEPGRQAWCSLHDTELPSDQTEHQKCRYRKEQSRSKS